MRLRVKNIFKQLRNEITKRKRVEGEMSKLSQALEQSPSISVITDIKGCIEYVNPRFTQLTGYAREEVIGQNPRIFKSGETATEEYKRIWEIITNGGTWKGEFHNKKKNGELYWESASISSIKNPDGVISNFIKVAENITERKLMEKDMEKYRHQLEILVKERTQKLEDAQEELIQKERLAALGQLVSIVSHELRNPLGTILASISFIREHLRGKGLGVDRALDRAERNVDRCDGIIDELLFYTRKRDLDLETTLIDTWLNEVLDEQSMPDGIMVKKELSAGKEILLDRERFRRCIVNLINNANEAMLAEDGTPQKEHEGQVVGQLTVETRIEHNRLRVRISDTGPGIPQDELEKIFEPLYSTKSTGIGLGLSITKQIVEQHGGGIEIKSEPGNGATVTLWLPVQSQ
jgi:PAS domain S-box-containing protein